MAKRNTPERKEELRKRRERQLARIPTFPKVQTGKYIPSGPLKNLKPENV